MKRWRQFPKVPTVRIASDGFIPRWAERKRTDYSISTHQALIWCASRTNAAVTGCPLSDLIRKVFNYDLVYEVPNPQSASFELTNQKLKICICYNTFEYCDWPIQTIHTTEPCVHCLLYTIPVFLFN